MYGDDPSSAANGAPRRKNGEFRIFGFAFLSQALLGLAFLVYIALRIYFVGITHDEVVTYDFHITDTWSNIVLYRSGMAPDNNHVLFTLLAKLVVGIFGLSVTTLRIPSFLGALLFYLGLQVIFAKVPQLWIRLLGTAAIAFNPYLDDFFGLARGYGLGLGFTILGVGLVLTAAEGFELRRWGYACGAALCFGLAALSQFTFVLVLGAGLAFLFIAAAISEPSSAGSTAARLIWKARTFLAIGWPTFPVVLYLTIPYRAFGTSDLVRLGGHAGFWKDTVGSLLDGTFYGSPEINLQLGTSILKFWIAVVCVLALVFAAVQGARPKGASAAFVVVFFFVIAASTASIFEVYLLNVSYLSERRGIFLIPLFLSAAVLLLAAVLEAAPYWIGILFATVEVPVLALLALHNLMMLNLYWTKEWRFDASTPQLMAVVQQTLAQRWPGQEVHLRAEFPLVPSINFYRLTMPVTSLAPVNRDDGVDGAADLYVVRESSPDYAIARSHADEVVARYPLTGVVLLAGRPDKR